MRRTLPLAARVKERIVALVDDNRVPQVRIAERLKKSPAAVSGVVRGDTPVSLDFLEAVSELAQVPVAELVAPPDTLIRQLDDDEAFVIRTFRRWPKTVVRALRAFLTFFADEPPAERERRVLHELIREMTPKQLRAVYGFALSHVEGVLSPGLRAQVFAQLLAEATAEAEKSQKNGAS